MRIVFFLALFICISGCFADRFLQDGPIAGGSKKIDLENPPQGFDEALEYIYDNYHANCKINSNTYLTFVKEAYIQIVAGRIYKVVFNVKNHSDKVLTVKLFEGLPNENGAVVYKINSCN